MIVVAINQDYIIIVDYNLQNLIDLQNWINKKGHIWLKLTIICKIGCNGGGLANWVGGNRKPAVHISKLVGGGGGEDGRPTKKSHSSIVNNKLIS